MPRQTPSRPTVTVPDGCRDDVVPLSDRRAEALAAVGVSQVTMSALVAGFDWPGPDPRTHLVLATVEGRGRLLVDGRAHELLPGTVAVCPARTSRRHWSDASWRLVTIRLADDDRWRRFRHTGPFVLDGEDPHRLAAPVLGILGELPPAVTAVVEASAGRGPMDEFLARFGAGLRSDEDAAAGSVPTEPFSLYATILTMQLDALLAGPTSVSDDELRLARLWQAVRREPGHSWTVESLARHLDVSRATLHRVVARHHDSSPGAIVERIRMDQAERLLVHGGLPVKVVAARVGYSSPYSFSAAFRRSRGCPPSEFRVRASEYRTASRSNSGQSTLPST